MATRRWDKQKIIARLQQGNYASRDEKVDLLKVLLVRHAESFADIAWLAFSADTVFRRAFIIYMQHNALDNQTFQLFLESMLQQPKIIRKRIIAEIIQADKQLLLKPLNNMIDEKGQTRAINRILLDFPDTPDIQAFLPNIIKSSNDSQCLTALKKLQSVAPAKLQSTVQDLLTSMKDLDDQTATRMLLKDGKYASIDLLVNLLQQAPGQLKGLIAQRLREIAVLKQGQALDKLTPLLVSSDDACRKIALDVLLNLPEHKRVLRVLLTYLKAQPGWIRDRALHALHKRRDLQSKVTQMLGDEDADLRLIAMLIAAQYRQPSVAAAICRVLEAPQWWLRVLAAEILGDMGLPVATPCLIKALEDEEARWAATDALGKLGDARALPALYMLLYDEHPDIRIEALQALKQFNDAKVLDTIRHLAVHDQMKAIRKRALDALLEMKQKFKVTIPGEQALRQKVRVASMSESEPMLHNYLITIRNQGASDLHLSVDMPPIVRIKGELEQMHVKPLTSEHIQRLINEILTPYQAERLGREFSLDFCYYIANVGRYRANAFYDHKGLNAVFRVIPESPPTLDEIGLPRRLESVIGLQQGLVVICGPASSGKSTTLNAFINLINSTIHGHIITIEDPVEFLHPFKKCLIMQREIGKHTRSCEQALRAALRVNPDVIVFGELRTRECVSLALRAVDTGNLVLCTMYAGSAINAINRLIATFPSEEQAQVRSGLAHTLELVIYQNLIKKADGSGLTAGFEILSATPAVRSLIIEDRLKEISQPMETAASGLHQTYDQAIMQLYRSGKITAEIAYAKARQKEQFQALLTKPGQEIGFAL